MFSGVQNARRDFPGLVSVTLRPNALDGTRESRQMIEFPQIAGLEDAARHIK